MSAINAYDVLTSRSFKIVDAPTSGDTVYGIHDNGKTRKCVQLTNAHDRVESADDIGTHPNSRRGH